LRTYLPHRRCAQFAITVGLGLLGLPAFASITFTCDPNIDMAVAGTCAALNGSTVAGLYGSAFSNANASIFIAYGATGLGASTQFYTTTTYSLYATALSTHEGDANDATAVNSLGGLAVNPVNPADGVATTSALDTALGLAPGFGIIEGAASGNGMSCTPIGSANCYNGFITVTSNTASLYYRGLGGNAGGFDFFSVVEHEVDEILGTSSCIVGVGTISAGCANGGTGISPADLFRYSGSGARSDVNSANGSVAYFSINSGVTNIAGYNNAPNGADYGDWDSTVFRIQNAFGTAGVLNTDINNDGGSEIAVLDAVGYNLVPEPGTLGLMGAACALLAACRFRRKA